MCRFGSIFWAGRGLDCKLTLCIFAGRNLVCFWFLSNVTLQIMEGAFWSSKNLTDPHTGITCVLVLALSLQDECFPPSTSPIWKAHGVVDLLTRPTVSVLYVHVTWLLWWGCTALTEFDSYGQLANSGKGAASLLTGTAWACSCWFRGVCFCMLYPHPSEYGA